MGREVEWRNRGVVEREDGECMAGVMIVYYIARKPRK